MQCSHASQRPSGGHWLLRRAGRMCWRSRGLCISRDAPYPTSSTPAGPVAGSRVGYIMVQYGPAPTAHAACATQDHVYEPVPPR
jgi:hypothetical protein